jgi:hypothetical protein
MAVTIPYVFGGGIGLIDQGKVDANFAAIVAGTATTSSVVLKSNNAVVACSAFARAVADGVGDETVNTTMNARVPHYAPPNSSITDLVIAFPGFSYNAPEVDWNTAFTVTAAIEYPAGTFTPCYTSDTGSRTLAITPGRTLAKFAPASTLVIPAGALFFVKVFASWSVGHMGGSSFTANMTLNGGYCHFAVADPDNTLVVGALSSNGVAAQGYSPMVYGRLTTPSAVLGILGTSHDLGAGDPGDVNGGGANAFTRALRGSPAVTVCRTGVTLANYATRPDGANMIFRDSVTHLIFDMGTNDIFAGTSAAATQALWTAAIAPYLSRGVKCYGTTISPRTTSTDNWLTVANQTVVSAPMEAQRLLFNADMRANYAAKGLVGYFDYGRAVDPTDSGLWGTDVGAVNCAGAGKVPRAWAIMSGGSISSMPLAFGAGVGTFPISSTIPCIVRNMPGDTKGTGAVVNLLTNGSGLPASFQIVNAGSNYLYPPMVCPAAHWTYDGIHFTSNAYDQVIAATGLRPEMFTL